MKTNDERIQDILKRLDTLSYIRPEEIPGIDLYMDQVTTFMDEHLKNTKRYPEDKVLTKTMINNYAKNHLLPPPQKKKYSREHMLLLIFIYYFKNILSIGDIQALLEPITEKYFQKKQDFDLTRLYNEVFQLEKGQIEAMRETLIQNWDLAQSTFEDAPEEDQEFLKQFSFICLLSFDVYVKKQVIEKMIDNLPERQKK